MTLIGVISDTHGVLSPAAYASMAECDVVIHAGDICNPRILRELQTLAPVYAVLGNNDYDEYGPDASGQRVSWYSKPVIDGVRFLVAHYPRDVRKAGLASGVVAAGEPLARVCIHGHTHTPRLETGAAAFPADLVMCPGSVSRPRGSGPSVGYITIDNARIVSATIQTLDGTLLAQM